ncbi:Leukotriene A-4 hydrolase [Apophysomyces ossiformis]|uniref:Leukotriene A(4) hydrolase n=1 Tax=Apophysomyces ossiformis TaxID=679940 RepID=A0A8H7ERL5_9FUNG|nr:Leukotriene A-4 hydrolase [Apophysomyces ossiformis]
MAQDPSSLSNLSDIKTTHLHLTWTISFEEKRIFGTVLLDLVALRDTNKVVLDTSYLDVARVSLEGSSLNFSLNDRHPTLGSALVIDLPATTIAGSHFQLEIEYTTTDRCTAIQFLTPEQTVGKQHPYLFSQCQAIHARSFVPCQDSPSIKLTYSASVTSPLPVVMSALSVSSESSGLSQTYKFRQPTTIPTYLIAIAAGNLASRDIGPRSKVWCEPEVVESAAAEFEDTEQFISIGEKLLTPYEWGRYDVLVLPPSFPYGGMENPCLTFVTPTLLAGDKSAVQVVAHEVSHSWMGNLVTTKTWEHFWLNEGWTVFTERKIAGRMHGEAHRQFSAIIGWKALKESVALFGETSPATVLKPDLSSGVDPDDYFSSVPYEKGFNLLYHIEKTVGGPAIFEPYMKAHVERFASQSITTEDWKQHLYEYFGTHHGQAMIDRLNTIDFDHWIHSPGMPPVDPQFDTSLADACYDLAHKWDAARNTDDFSAFSADDVRSFNALQKVVFLERLADTEPLPLHALAKMDELYQLTEISNADVRFRWQKLCLMASYEPIYKHVVAFITSQGRMKFVRPLYRLLYKANAALAKDTYNRHRLFYHPIAATLIEKDIDI